MTAHPYLPTSDQLVVTKAVQCLSNGAASLRQSAFWLDDGGYECAALDDLAHDASALVAVWAGRAAPISETVPAYITESAVEWRRQAGRSY
ncbi:MAG: hypothetical protein JNK47_02880 [Mesorhizobium sp.]|nr:hypothetical protein [Mesorhizobium sp.]MBL8576145.1 hypothetical protein [Mesorhizobium sp.]